MNADGVGFIVLGAWLVGLTILGKRTGDRWWIATKSRRIVLLLMGSTLIIVGSVTLLERLGFH
jgi:hypothetical protein